LSVATGERNAVVGSGSRWGQPGIVVR
jgi:hypothetical protein